MKYIIFGSFLCIHSWIFFFFFGFCSFCEKNIVIRLFYLLFCSFKRFGMTNREKLLFLMLTADYIFHRISRMFTKAHTKEAFLQEFSEHIATYIVAYVFFLLLKTKSHYVYYLLYEMVFHDSQKYRFFQVVKSAAILCYIWTDFHFCIKKIEHTTQSVISFFRLIR